MVRCIIIICLSRKLSFTNNSESACQHSKLTEYRALRLRPYFDVFYTLLYHFSAPWAFFTFNAAFVANIDAFTGLKQDLLLPRQAYRTAMNYIKLFSELDKFFLFGLQRIDDRNFADVINRRFLR